MCKFKLKFKFKLNIAGYVTPTFIWFETIGVAQITPLCPAMKWWAKSLVSAPTFSIGKLGNALRWVVLLKIDGTMCVVGSVGPTGELDTAALIFGRRKLAGSLVGGIKETQEMLDFCGKHNITSDIELINMQSINEAYERMLKSDVKYRFVIDMKSLNKTA